MKLVWAWIGHLILLGVFFWWTGFSDASKLSVAMSIVVALVWIGVFFWLQKRIFAGALWSEALFRPRFWGAVILFVASLAVAKLLVGWIPNVSGLGSQLFSFTLRFGLAWTLINATWVGIAWQTTLPPVGNGLSPKPGE